MRIGDYELENELGRGAVGVVYRARHVATGAVRAVKFLEQATDATKIERFRREAEALARAGGTIAVPIHESGLSNGRFYFVMDLMPGGSLADRLARGGPIPWREAAALVATLAREVARLHTLGLIHRDLKPANVLFGDDGSPRVADFGCVRDLAQAALTQTGVVLGTPAYMPPEQLAGQGISPAIDVFALGAILHELVAGTRPFAAPNLLERVTRITAGNRARLEPRELDVLVTRAVSADPALRPDAATLAADLEKLAAAVEPPRPPRLTLLPLVAAGLLLVGVIALASRRTPAPIPPVVEPSPLLDRARRLTAPVTSRDLSAADLAIVASADLALAERIALLGPSYAFSDVRTAWRDAPASPALATLWGRSALGAGLREPARRALGRGTGTVARRLVAALDAALALARLVEPGRIGQQVEIGPKIREQVFLRSAREAAEAIMTLTPEEAPPDALTTVLAPLAVPLRRAATDACRMRGSADFGGVYDPEAPIRNNVLSALGTIDQGAGRPDQERLGAEAFVELAFLRELRAADLPRLEKAARELAESDALLSAAALERACGIELVREQAEARLDDGLPGRARLALERLAASHAAGADAIFAALLRHALERTLLGHLLHATGAAESVPEREALARARALEREIRTYPQEAGIAYDAHREEDARLLLLAALIEREEPSSVDPALLRDVLPDDWVRTECTRVAGDSVKALETALQLASRPQPDSAAARHHLVAALAAIDIADRGRASEELDWLEARNFDRLESGRYAVSEVRRRLESRLRR